MPWDAIPISSPSRRLNKAVVSPICMNVVVNIGRAAISGGPGGLETRPLQLCRSALPNRPAQCVCAVLSRRSGGFQTRLPLYVTLSPPCRSEPSLCHSERSRRISRSSHDHTRSLLTWTLRTVEFEIRAYQLTYFPASCTLTKERPLYPVPSTSLRVTMMPEGDERALLAFLFCTAGAGRSDPPLRLVQLRSPGVVQG